MRQDELECCHTEPSWNAGAECKIAVHVVGTQSAAVTAKPASGSVILLPLYLGEAAECKLHYIQLTGPASAPPTGRSRSEGGSGAGEVAVPIQNLILAPVDLRADNAPQSESTPQHDSTSHT